MINVARTRARAYTHTYTHARTHAQYKINIVLEKNYIILYIYQRYNAHNLYSIEFSLAAIPMSWSNSAMSQWKTSYSLVIVSARTWAASPQKKSPRTITRTRFRLLLPPIPQIRCLVTRNAWLDFASRMPNM